MFAQELVEIWQRITCSLTISVGDNEPRLWALWLVITTKKWF